MIRPNPNILPSDWQTPEELSKVAAARVRAGLSPPAEIYQIQYRSRIDWSEFPEWARPLDPEAFDGCCHEG
ncbi:MAG: hypothetical protein H6822_04130 [Planctomycetaceae bacterium]|nr:hypothetical protein [Planctomycetales bacterium]MCB9921346.1 hypothetical protein [Planctomycetaceae bacterium]